MRLLLDRVDTFVGAVIVAADEHGALCSLDFADCELRMRRLLARRFGNTELHEADDPGGHASRVRAYCAGDLRAFDGAPLRTGGTAFQQSVWAALRAIPAGTVVAYSDVARTLGLPRAVRAVGAANGANPIVLAVPCHRVIGADGSLTGYGGGLARKRALLAHEGAPIYASQPRLVA